MCETFSRETWLTGCEEVPLRRQCRAMPAIPTIESAVSTRVEEYRERAEALRRSAGQTRFPAAQTRLRAMADSFDRLADHAEAREQASVED
jgi:hypothetical protein